MKKRILFLLCFCLFAAISIFAQTKTVTNADLDKFRAKRVQAERDYRENYARLGFPSPEELDRQIEKSRIEREELSARLRSERLERERAEAIRAEIARIEGRINYLESIDTSRIDSGFYTYGNRYFYDPYFRKRRRHTSIRQNIGNGIPVVDYYGAGSAPANMNVPPSSTWKQ
jgi:negative regulator of genetic competence, sporulation and motility